ncbi:MAG: thiamine pyrophosphate-binding protein [Bilophila sp.]
MQLNGARILIECLFREGVDLIFGYPGGAVLQIYDELPHYGAVQHILVRHEQAAVHAADGYARATGKAGVMHGHLGARRYQRGDAASPRA